MNTNGQYVPNIIEDLLETKPGYIWKDFSQTELFRPWGGFGQAVLLDPGVNAIILLLEKLGVYSTSFSCDGDGDLERFHVVFSEIPNYPIARKLGGLFNNVVCNVVSPYMRCAAIPPKELMTFRLGFTRITKDHVYETEMQALTDTLSGWLCF